MGASGKRSGARRVQAVERALDILGHLAVAPTGLGLSELGRAMGLTPQTVQSLVRTLQDRGWIDQDGVGTPYRLGAGPGRLHHRWIGSQDRAGLAREIVQEAAHETGERLLLAEFRGNALIPLVEVAGTSQLQVGPDSVTPGRLHLMATGRVLLASLLPASRARIIDACRLDGPAGPHAPRTLTELNRRVATVARTGRAVCRDENGAGVSALAMPVVAGDGTWIAALGMSLPTARLTRHRQTELLAMLRTTATDVGKAWGEV